MRKYDPNRTFYLDFTQTMCYNEQNYVYCGGRGCGKSTGVQMILVKDFLKRGRKFMWWRIKDVAVKELSAGPFFDLAVRTKYHIKKSYVKTDIIYADFGEGIKEVGRVGAIASFYNLKGTPQHELSKEDKADIKDKVKKTTKKLMAGGYYNCCLDEMNLEATERSLSAPIAYCLSNTIETLFRLDNNFRLFMLGNTLAESSELLVDLFGGFCPNDYGIYHLRKYDVVIQMIEDSDKYKAAREQSWAGKHYGSHSTFTNRIMFDDKLVTKKKHLSKQTAAIYFDNMDYFVVCDGKVITKQKIAEGNKKIQKIALKPLIIGVQYDKNLAKMVIDNTLLRQFEFQNRSVMTMFQTRLKYLLGE